MNRLSEAAFTNEKSELKDKNEQASHHPFFWFPESYLVFVFSFISWDVSIYSEGSSNRVCDT